MANFFSSNFKLGILGGGQLGKMMLYETRKYDIEIETVNTKALEKLEQEGKKVYPSSKTLEVIQNKGTQKLFYNEKKIPTAKFRKFSNKAHLTEAITSNQIKLPFVWKSTQGGYDGKGVSVITSGSDVAKLADVECIAEEMVDFKNELAVIVVRSVSGEVKTYPVVEMEFHPEANQVEYVICPARIDQEIADKAIEIAKKVSNAFEHVGVLAVEMFQTQDDQILVNEVAPRPHNSGHYSIEASYTNQFEQHIRAILDLPLGKTHSKLGGIMVNLVGAEGYVGDVIYENIEDIMKMPGVTPHIYGKKQTRPFRKMGHVTIIHKDINEARKIAEKVKNTIKVVSK